MQTEIHDAIIELIKPAFDARFPNETITFPNDAFDWNNPPKRFVAIGIDFLPGGQVGMAAEPLTRITGVIYVTAYVRQGAGTRDARIALDWFADLLKYRRVSIANLQAPEPNGNATSRGYYSQELRVSFYSDPA